MVFPQKANAHVEVAGSEFLDALAHFNGSIGTNPNQQYRNWTDVPSDTGTQSDANPSNPYCEIIVTERHRMPDGPNGRPRYAYRFKVVGNADGRAHVFEAGGYADSSTPNCKETYNNAWNGERVFLDNQLFRNPVSGATKQRPVNVYLGVTSAQEAYSSGQADSIRQSAGSDWDDFDLDVKRAAGIKQSTAGGAYGFIADAGGYKVNGQNVWCAGISIGDLTGSTNIQWPGNFDNANDGGCYWDFRFKAGSQASGPSGGNYDTNWGAYALGAMGARQLNGSNAETSTTSTGVRCVSEPCPLGSAIPGATYRSDGTIDDFDLIVAGIKNQDGSGTYNGNPLINDPQFGNDVDSIARRSPNPNKVPFAEAWLVMEWDPRGVDVIPQISCEITFNPRNPEPGQSFGVTMNYGYSGDATTLEGRGQFTSSGIDNTRVNVGPTNIADTGGTEVEGSYSMGTYTANAAGEYNYDALLRLRDNIAVRDDCDKTVVVAAKPFFKVWTNDVHVGGGFNNGQTACTVRQADATIIGYGGDDLVNRFTGSSGEYGVSALGEIRNFFSAGRRSPRGGAQPTPPHGLTFANAEINGINGTDPVDNRKVVDYGGVSGNRQCADDWLARLPTGLTATQAASVSASTFTGGVIHNNRSGVVTITGGTVTEPTAIFLTGENVEVVINGIIDAEDDATLYIITSGNIKISNTTPRVYAALITTKTLFTCTSSTGTLFNAGQLYDNCGGSGVNGTGKLVINGAVIADQVKLQRTAGTRRTSVENGSAIFSTAAEDLIFDMKLYTIMPPIGGTPQQKSQIDFITSLPPIL